MINLFRILVVVALTFIGGFASAQDCATAVAPACGGTCAPGSTCLSDDSQGIPACACFTVEALGVKKLSIKLNFAKPALDSIQLQGTLAIPAGFAVDGARFIVNVGGVVKSFTLDEKGKAKVGTDQAQLAVKAKGGVVDAQTSKYSIKLAKGSFQTQLADEGLTNTTVTEAAVSIDLDVDLNNHAHVYKLTQPQTYTAKQGKTGKTK